MSVLVTECQTPGYLETSPGLLQCLLFTQHSQCHKCQNKNKGAMEIKDPRKADLIPILAPIK